MRTLGSLLALTLILGACAPPRVIHHAAPLPPEIQKAQDQVWDLQFQLYQAQHDLAIAQINEKEAQLQSQRNGNPGAYSSQYLQLNSQLEEQRGKVENRFSLAQQWYSDVQAGDLDAAHDVQVEMNQP